MNPDYQAVVAALANALPSPPRPLPPWAPSVSFLLTQLLLSVVLLCLAVLFAVESWLRITDTQGNGDEASVVSVTHQAGYVVYEYALTDPDGTRLTDRASALRLFARRLKLVPKRAAAVLSCPPVFL